MIRLRKFLPFVAVLVVAAMLWSPTQAQASFAVKVVTLSNPGGTIINDGGGGDLDTSVNNSITVNYSDASYNLVGTISTTNSPGTPTLAQVDVSYNINTNAAGKTGGAAQLLASATGFTQPSTNPLLMTSSLNGNGTNPGTISLTQFVATSGSNNALFTIAGAGVFSTPTQGPFNSGAPYNAANTSVGFSQVGPYTITDVLSFNLGGFNAQTGVGSNTSGDAQSNVTPNAVPVPAGLFLVLSAMPVLGLGTWLRRRRK